MTIYQKKELLLKKWRYLKQLALDCEDFETCLLIRQQENKIYNQWLFYKYFLKQYEEDKTK